MKDILLRLTLFFVAKKARGLQYQSANDTYLLNGVTEWGDSLFVSTAVREKTIIVTVFFEDII